MCAAILAWISGVSGRGPAHEGGVAQPMRKQRSGSIFALAHTNMVTLGACAPTEQWKSARCRLHEALRAIHATTTDTVDVKIINSYRVGLRLIHPRHQLGDVSPAYQALRSAILATQARCCNPHLILWRSGADDTWKRWEPKELQKLCGADQKSEKFRCTCIKRH